MSWVIMTVVSPSLLMQRAVVVAERIAGEGIERAERLVHQHDPRSCRQRPGDADALALAARQFMRKAVAMLGAVEPHQIEQLIHPRGNLRRRRAQQFWRDPDIVGDAHMREQSAALEHIADAAAQSNRIDRAHVLALDRDAAAVGVDQPVRQPQQRGLAGAGAADDGEEFALGDIERDVVHGQNTFRAAAAVEALADMRKGDQGRGGGHNVGTITPSSSYQAGAAFACCRRCRLNCRGDGGKPHAAKGNIGEARAGWRHRRSDGGRA